MADVRPIEAVHFNPEEAGPLQDLLAPPYDVIDAELRRELLARSPHNVVEIDLPEAPPGSDGDRYQHAAARFRDWLASGILTADSQPSLWALAQSYRDPAGAERTRNSILARIRVEEYGAGRIRPHERTQPGPKQDRLDLTRATGHNLSPIFALSTEDAWPSVDGVTAAEPWAETTDLDGTRNRIWRIADPELHAKVTEALGAAELLIADGHHRYETARTFAEEVGGEGPHRYVLAALTGLDDPGLTVFPTHRLLSLDEGASRELEDKLAETFDLEAVDEAGTDPAGLEGVGVFGYRNARTGRNLRLRLRERARIDQAMADRSAAYRELDAAILETAVLTGILGMTTEDIAAKRGLDYGKSLEEVDARLGSGELDAAFILRPTPIEAVKEVAAGGETMPPKSTFFYPKIPTGIVFTPVRADA